MRIDAYSKASLAKRPAEERGQTELDWRHNRHVFSFGNYYDLGQTGFRSLRVLNDDIIEPGQSFETHSHRDAEIFSYVIEGELEHRDSMGHGSIIKAGHLQYMSAGSGLQHSEFNPSKTKRVRFLQARLMPESSGGEPRYVERELGKAARDNALTLLLSGEPQGNAIEIRLDAKVYLGRLEPGHILPVVLGAGRHVWLHVIEGEISVLNKTLKERDGMGISQTYRLEISARRAAQFLLFYLP